LETLYLLREPIHVITFSVERLNDSFFQCNARSCKRTQWHTYVVYRKRSRDQRSLISPASRYNPYNKYQEYLRTSVVRNDLD